MTIMQFEKFDTALRAIHGSVTINGLTRESATATIEIPAKYLKYVEIKMPTTDFCKKKPETDNRINGLPEIKKIETYNDRVVKVTFIDDTFTKAVCSENDHFDLDVGITVCCMKRLFGKDGSRHYNNLIRHAHDIIVKNDKAKEKVAREKAEKRMKDRKAELRKAAKKLKAKEELIDIQKQAIIRAHQEMEELKNEEA